MITPERYCYKEDNITLYFQIINKRVYISNYEKEKEFIFWGSKPDTLEKIAKALTEISEFARKKGDENE